MIRNISIGIDIGTSMTRVIVGEYIKGEDNPKIIGVGEAPTVGMRHGYVVSKPEVVKSLKNAVLQAEKTSDIKVRRAYVSMGGSTLKSFVNTGNAIISKADSEVTNLDINNALLDCEENINLSNKKILQVFPISYKLDGKEVLGRPEGMHGNKLEAKALFVTCSNQHFEDLMEIITLADIDPVDVIASPIAASYVALSKKQKIVGGALINIGAETVSMVIYENETPIALHTFSIGGEDITNDIALVLKIPLEEAEQVKLGNFLEKYPKKKVDDIINARLSDIFELIENHLKKIKRNELLPAGVIWIGGGSNIVGLEEASKSALKLPVRIGSTEMFGNVKTKLRDPSWFVALGLIISGKEGVGHSDAGMSNIFKDIKSFFGKGLKQLLP